MEYAAIAIAALGFSVGLFFRMKTLLPLVGLLVLAALVFCVMSQFSFVDTAVTILITQVILQGCYFLGLSARALLTGSGGSPHIL